MKPLSRRLAALEAEAPRYDHIASLTDAELEAALVEEYALEYPDHADAIRRAGELIAAGKAEFPDYDPRQCRSGRDMEAVDKEWAAGLARIGYGIQPPVA